MGWLVTVPPIRMRKVDNKGDPLTYRQEAKRLLDELTTPRRYGLFHI